MPVTAKPTICKLTREPGKFVKAHIIPRAFFLETKEDGEYMEILSSGGHHPPKRSRTGIYDEELVTAKGEDFFNQLDDYAYKLLSPRPRRRDYVRDENGFIVRSEQCVPLAYLIKNFDHAKIRRFFDSLLWRMSASQHEFYSAVKVEFEEELRARILKREPSTTALYNVVIGRHFDKHGSITFSPHKLTNAPFSAIRAICGRFSFTFIFDSRQAEINEALLTEGRPLVVLTSPLQDSSYIEFAKKVVWKTMEKWDR